MKTKFKYLFSLVLPAILVPLIFFQACNQPSTPAEHSSSENSEQKSIKDKTKLYTEAFNQHNADKMASLWSQNARYTNLATDESLQGIGQIVDYFKDLFQEKGANTIEFSLLDVKTPSPDKATAKGTYQTSFKDGHTNKNAFIAEYIKEKGDWVIDNFSFNEIFPPNSNHKFLKDLDWLAGDWIDNDENINVEYKNQWDKNKNFLTQQFTTKIFGQEDLNGFQIIGWDPIDQEIRSWIFDSEGTYGESSWVKNDNTWYVDTVFTLPNGDRAMASFLYTKIDDNNYDFTIEDRSIEDKQLPDIGPIKIVRKQ